MPKGTMKDSGLTLLEEIKSQCLNPKPWTPILKQWIKINANIYYYSFIFSDFFMRYKMLEVFTKLPKKVISDKENILIENFWLWGHLKASRIIREDKDMKYIAISGISC